jgi:hypothetical protein
VTDPDQLQRDIYDFRLHLDQIYLDCNPRLLDDKGMFVAFLAFLRPWMYWQASTRPIQSLV